ncbi:amidoligase family protein [Paenibacillus alkalitolerans]|uniref:amidoligase family protein n=1 Tax=Paenibacillus alkalitolerans TaxID=2799335 RepID=UPI0018F6D764|nr:amidoligase family protein [Paenibacillus alkalitolerans]
MWPKIVDWKNLRFGVEIEFIGGKPEQVELLPGWIMSLDELQIDETGEDSGSELKPPPMLWEDRGQIREMLTRLQALGASSNWSCGLHVHIGLEPWGQDIVLPLLDAAVKYQESIQALLNTAEHRLVYCPPVTPEMRERFLADPGPTAFHHRGRPQSHRCGINLAAWFDIRTVEIRYANGSLGYDEVINTIEFCLRFVAAVGAGRELSSDPQQMAAQLGASLDGYPPSVPTPRWFRERTWLEESLIPALQPLAAHHVKDGEIHHVLPVPDGILVSVEDADGKLTEYVLRPPAEGWELVRGPLM